MASYNTPELAAQHYYNDPGARSNKWDRTLFMFAFLALILMAVIHRAEIKRELKNRKIIQ